MIIKSLNKQMIPSPCVHKHLLHVAVDGSCNARLPRRCADGLRLIIVGRGGIGAGLPAPLRLLLAFSLGPLWIGSFFIGYSLTAFYLEMTWFIAIITNLIFVGITLGLLVARSGCKRAISHLQNST